MTLAAVKSAWAFVRDHIKWFLGIGIALLVAVVIRPKLGKQELQKKVELETQVVEAKAAARKAQVELGAAKAAEQIKAEHAEALNKLDAAQKARAQQLEANPEALVEAILRASKS